LDSSALLISAASGLEKLMVSKTLPSSSIKDSSVAQISAAIYYKASVVAKLSESTAFQEKFRRVLCDQIGIDFGNYIDSQARTKPKTLHHVYEWKKTGNADSRLFKLIEFGENKLSFKIKYEFLDSKTNVPSVGNRKKYKFPNKAYIMENGIPVTISPRAAKRLVFEVNGYTVFMPKGASVTISKPGGGKATGQFRLAYAKFFTGQLVNESIRRSGFQNIFNRGMNQALKVPAGIKKVQYSFSPNTVRSQANSALQQAFGGALV
jgi:hypothetical protein